MHTRLDTVSIKDMGAGAYVGRVGGLAVFLGVGVAVFTGAGIASAADEGAGADASSTTSTSQSASNEKPAKSEPKGLSGKSDDGSKDVADTSKDVAATDEKADDTTAVDDDTSKDAAEGEAKPDADKPAKHPHAEGDETAVDEQPAEKKSESDEDEAAVTQAVTLADPPSVDKTDDSGKPGVPALASLAMSLVTAGRDATDKSEQSAEDVTTTSLAAAADPTYPYPTDVKVKEVVAPLEFLQYVPVLGRYVVTPVVRFIHTIPLVGEVLHPLIGWPVDHDAPPGTPKARTVRVTSFDGTSIYVHFMPAKGLKAGQEAPTILDGPGLGLPGATTIDLKYDGLLPNDVIGVGELRANGYNVVTWDPRGEWHSGGVMHLDSPDLEGRDVSAIISWVASLGEAQLDSVNDPRIGMVGASYGGGIQLATAAIDHRIDAIVPTIAWNNLVDVLFPRKAVNSAWGTLLPTVLALTGQRPYPRIYPVAIQGVLFGTANQSDIDLLASFGYQDQIQDITTPTLLIQGTVDTLFGLSQADINARALIAAGTTTKVIWYCGGHGTCLSDYNDGKVVRARTMDWLARYVKGQNVDTKEQFEYVDQNGDWHSSPTYPATEDLTPIVAESDRPKTLGYIGVLGGSGPNPLILTTGPLGTLLGLPSAGYAFNAYNLHVPDATVQTQIVGAPELTLTYSGTGNAKHVYAQIVDDETGLVLGNQVTPIPVQLDGDTHTITYSLEQVAQTLKPGQSVTVQISTSAFKYFNFYSYGSITVQGASIKLPTLGEAATSQEPVAAA